MSDPVEISLPARTAWSATRFIRPLLCTLGIGLVAVTAWRLHRGIDQGTLALGDLWRAKLLWIGIAFVVLGLFPKQRFAPIEANLAAFARPKIVAFVAMGLCTAGLAIHFLPLLSIVTLMMLAGIAYGITSPLRDIQVRAVTPDGLVGVAFGFVSTGLGLGAALAPVMCGWIMDNSRPDFVFYALAVMALGAVVVILAERKPSA